MGYADRVPNRDMMSEHQRVPRGVPILGSTDYHLAVAVLARFRCARSRWWAGSSLHRPAIGLAAHHHGPDDACHLVGQRDRRELLRLARPATPTATARCGRVWRPGSPRSPRSPATAAGPRPP